MNLAMGGWQLKVGERVGHSGAGLGRSVVSGRMYLFLVSMLVLGVLLLGLRQPDVGNVSGLVQVEEGLFLAEGDTSTSGKKLLFQVGGIKVYAPGRPSVEQAVCRREASLLKQAGWASAPGMPPLRVQICTATEYRLARDDANRPVYLLGEGVGQGATIQEAVKMATTDAVNMLLSRFYGELMRLFVESKSPPPRELFYQMVNTLWEEDERYRLVVYVPFEGVVYLTRCRKNLCESMITLAVERQALLTQFGKRLTERWGEEAEPVLAFLQP